MRVTEESEKSTESDIFRSSIHNEIRSLSTRISNVEQWRVNSSFIYSKSFYVVLTVAAVGAMIDIVLTTVGLAHGYVETRPFFWLQFVGLSSVITLMYLIMYKVDRQLVFIAALIFAIVMPLIPTVSNVSVLLAGNSPFL